MEHSHHSHRRRASEGDMPSCMCAFPDRLLHYVNDNSRFGEDTIVLTVGPTGNLEMRQSGQPLLIHQLESHRTEPKELNEELCRHQLCSICQELPQKLRSGKESELQTAEVLHASAETCPCCAIIVNAVPQWETFVPDNARKVSIVPKQHPRKQQLLLDVFDVSPGLLLTGVSLHFPSIEYGNRPAIREGNLSLCTTNNSQSARNGEVVGRIVLAPGNLSNVKVWLRDCLSRHEQCLPPAATASASYESRLPTRVIKIGTSNDYISLLETGGRVGDYLALSHRWGSAQILRTTKDNLEAHKTSISWEALTETFQDAIIVARSLGYQYLWIDSLCIVQDDAYDWANEASRMADIYQRATLTLSASVSMSGDEGLLTPRKRVNLVPLRDSDDHDMEPWAFFSDGRHADFMQDVAKGSLSTRAWCLQERLLSRRVLHFGRDQLHWECICAKWSESSIETPNDWNDQSGGEQRVPLSSPDAFNELRNPPLYFHPEICSDQIYTRPTYGKWYRLICAYTGRNLTVADDKLPALAGIAKTFAEYSGDSYVAGHWLRDAAPGLLWQTPYIGGPGQPTDHSYRLSRPRCPSWSWASCDERIDYPCCHFGKVSLNVLGGEAQLATADPYGQVISAYLDVEGVLRPLQKLYGFLPEDRARQPSTLPMFPDWVLHTEFDDCEDAEIEGVLCLYVADVGCGSRTCSQQGSCRDLHGYGLLLRLVEEGAYRRVGLAVVSQLDFMGGQPSRLRLV